MKLKQTLSNRIQIYLHLYLRLSLAVILIQIYLLHLHLYLRLSLAVILIQIYLLHLHLHLVVILEQIPLLILHQEVAQMKLLLILILTRMIMSIQMLANVLLNIVHLVFQIEAISAQFVIPTIKLIKLLALAKKYMISLLLFPL